MLKSNFFQNLITKSMIVRMSIPCHASAYVHCFPLPVPFPMKLYFPSQLKNELMYQETRVHLLGITTSFLYSFVTPEECLSVWALSTHKAKFFESCDRIKLFRICFEFGFSECFDFLKDYCKHSDFGQDE